MQPTYKTHTWKNLASVLITAQLFYTQWQVKCSAAEPPDLCAAALAAAADKESTAFGKARASDTLWVSYKYGGKICRIELTLTLYGWNLLSHPQSLNWNGLNLET